MERTPVESKTGMVGIGYDPATQTLEIEFKSRKEGEPGTLYHYHEFTQEHHDLFMAAQSKGSHFIKHVKPRFRCTKIGPAEVAAKAGAATVAIVLILLFAGAPAQAAPKWLTAAPRAVGRTYGNMFTFKHKELALIQWATMGAQIFDQKTTLDSFGRNRQVVETDMLYGGKRYGVGLAIIGTLVEGTMNTTIEQVSEELVKDDPNRAWRNIWRLTAVAPIALHIQSGIQNMGVGYAAQPIPAASQPPSSPIKTALQ